MSMVLSRALFIGRFQPFHNGHLFVIKKLLQDYGEVIVAIGSSTAERSGDNPFTAEERTAMIRACFTKSELARMHLVPVPDIGDHSKWVSHVQSLVPEFKIVFSNNEFVRSLFSKSGVSVHEMLFHDRELHEGKQIRKMLAQGDDRWKKLVPKPVAELIINMGKIGKKRKD